MTVVGNAIFEYKLHIVQKFLHPMIVVSRQPQLDCAKVHWLILYHSEVIRGRFKVDGFLKVASVRAFPQLAEEALGRLVPGLVERGLVGEAGERQGFESGGVAPEES